MEGKWSAGGGEIGKDEWAQMAALLPCSFQGIDGNRQIDIVISQNIKPRESKKGLITKEASFDALLP